MLEMDPHHDVVRKCFILYAHQVDQNLTSGDLSMPASVSFRPEHPTPDYGTTIGNPRHMRNTSGVLRHGVNSCYGHLLVHERVLNDFHGGRRFVLYTDHSDV